MTLKTALMSTAMLLALCATASADDFAITTEGLVSFGYNDEAAGNTFLLAELEFEAGQIFDGGLGWNLYYELEGENFGFGDATDYDDEIRLDIIASFGTLSFGELDDSASETYYADPDGMANGFEGATDLGIGWVGSIGENIGYAVSSANLNDDADDNYSIGLGYTSDTLEIGFGYENASTSQDEAYGISATLIRTIGSAEAAFTVAYVDVNGDSSIGVSAEAEFTNGLTLEAAYGFNNGASQEDGYAVVVEYENGPLVFEAEYEYDSGIEEYSVDIAYTIETIAPEGTTVYAGYAYETGSSDDTGFYAGLGFAFNENTTFGIAYSETDDAGDLEIASPGTSAFITVTF